jgi:lysophospholipase L1-like esterase
VGGRPAAPAPRAAFFGSSTVAGVGASAPDRRWTALAAARLGWTEVNLGLSGSTLARAGFAPSALDRREELVAARPDVVVVQYGANDVRAGIPVAAFADAARELLAAVREALPRARLVVAEPQPAPSLEARRAPYDAALADAARAAGAEYVTLADAFPATAHAVDDIHVDDAGHAAVAARFVRALEGAGEAPIPQAFLP